MAQQLFSNKSLVGKGRRIMDIGNWYEDRLIKEQAFKKYPNEFLVPRSFTRQLRDEEPAVSALPGSHVPKPLGRLKRRYKWDTGHIVPDDGFVRQLRRTRGNWEPSSRPKCPSPTWSSSRTSPSRR